MTEFVPLAAITLDVELQPRDEIDKELVGDYIALLMDGVELPPVLAFQNGDDTILLSDGFHRYYAHKGLKLETIAVDLRRGDRLDAIRASLAANATHGQPRNEKTLVRAYGLAVKRGLVDAADSKGVAELLRCSTRAASELTKDARDDRKKANVSIALALQARGLTQRQIADKLGVTHITVGRWLEHFGSVPECSNEPTLPDAETLDAIAQAIKDDAKGEVREEVEAEVREELAELRTRFEEQIADLRKQMQEAEERQKAASAEVPAQIVEPPIVAEIREVERALAAELDTEEEKQVKLDTAIRNFKAESIVSEPWNICWNVVEAVEALHVETLRQNSYPRFEAQLRQRLQAAAEKLTIIHLITERSR